MKNLGTTLEVTTATPVSSALERLARGALATRSRTIRRFQKAEILLHWAIAAPFLLCYVTAIILLAIYNPAPEHPFRAVFSWIHCISGVCLTVLPLPHGTDRDPVHVGPHLHGDDQSLHRKGLPGMFLGWVDREWARHHYTAW